MFNGTKNSFGEIPNVFRASLNRSFFESIVFHDVYNIISVRSHELDNLDNKYVEFAILY